MVWGHKDFMRELQRQLIELQALRRKINEKHAVEFEAVEHGPESENVEESLEKLENSQQQLLRKIDELFSTHVEVKISGVLKNDLVILPNTTPPAQTSSPPAEGAAEPAAAKNPAQHDTSPEYLIACLHSLLQQPQVLQHLANLEPGSQADQVTDCSSLAEVFESSASSAVVQQRCRYCGKLLVSSALAGEQIVQEGDEWYHESCRGSLDGAVVLDDPDAADDGSEILWQPSLLN